MILFKNEKGKNLSLSLFLQTVLKMLALVNKDRDYQELSVEDIELAVTEIVLPSYTIVHNIANVNQVRSC